MLIALKKEIVSRIKHRNVETAYVNFPRPKERAFWDWVGFKAGLSYLSKTEKTSWIRENLFRPGGSKTQ